jgi:elongation factor P--beta-lysine ligase
MHIIGSKQSIDQFDPLNEVEFTEIKQQLMAALASGMPEQAPVAMQLDHICRLIKTVQALQLKLEETEDETKPKLIIPS